MKRQRARGRGAWIVDIDMSACTRVEHCPQHADTFCLYVFPHKCSTSPAPGLIIPLVNRVGTDIIPRSHFGYPSAGGGIYATAIRPPNFPLIRTFISLPK
ncbi:hypothetical protein BDR07DRAFT_1409648 [Suillus spraguei]|nr:hypothetical protein BDR07DRAFT_1409648 [Suillus spraguei]